MTHPEFLLYFFISLNWFWGYNWLCSGMTPSRLMGQFVMLEIKTRPVTWKAITVHSMFFLRSPFFKKSPMAYDDIRVTLGCLGVLLNTRHVLYHFELSPRSFIIFNCLKLECFITQYLCIHSIPSLCILPVLMYRYKKYSKILFFTQDFWIDFRERHRVA